MIKKTFFSKLMLGLTFCLNLPTNITAEDQMQQPTPEQIAFMKSMIEQQVEILEELLTNVREQTSTIGFCMQQLQQQIQNGKISCNDENKIDILTKLAEMKSLTDGILKTILIQVNPDGIKTGIILNHALLSYIIPILQKDITTLNIKDLDAIIESTITKYKKSEDLDPEQFELLLEQNKTAVKELTELTDYVGFTWYNKAYRGFNNWYGPSILKGAALLTATGILTCYAGTYLQKVLPESIRDANWFKNYIADNAISYGKDGKFRNSIPLFNEDKTPQIDMHGNQIIDTPVIKDLSKVPFFQRLRSTLEDCQTAGIVAVGALTQIELKSIFSYLYGTQIAEAKEQGKKKLKDLDKFLLGIDKKQRDTELDKVTFDDMIGAENLKEIGKNIANFMKHPERYERAQIEEYKGILLYGPPGTGKTLFAAAFRNVINEEMQSDGKGKKVQFIDAKAILDQNPGMTVEYLFWAAQQQAPAIIFFDEIDLVGAHREKNPITTGQLLTAMDGIDSTKQVIVIGATNKPDQLDSALLRDGRFGKIIPIDYPSYEERIKFLEKEMVKRNIDVSPELIQAIAQETEGCSYNNLKRIITEAYARSMRQMRTVNEQDFDMAFDTEIRKIQLPTEISEANKQVTAIYQAGKAVARHLLKTQKTVVKVTTNPVQFPIKVMEKHAVETEDKAENKKLADTKVIKKLKAGEVFTKSITADNELLSDEDQIHEAMALLAGTAAHQLLLDKTYTSCNPQDRAQAMEIIYNLISNGEKVDDKTKAQGIELKNTYEEQMIKILENNKELLQKVIDTLLAQGTIDRYQWTELIQ